MAAINTTEIACRANRPGLETDDVVHPTQRREAGQDGSTH